MAKKTFNVKVNLATLKYNVWHLQLEASWLSAKMPQEAMVLYMCYQIQLWHHIMTEASSLL